MCGALSWCMRTQTPILASGHPARPSRLSEWNRPGLNVHVLLNEANLCTLATFTYVRKCPAI